MLQPGGKAASILGVESDGFGSEIWALGQCLLPGVEATTLVVLLRRLLGRGIAWTSFSLLHTAFLLDGSSTVVILKTG